MKLCWYNIENLRLSRYGNFRDVVRKRTVYLKVCEVCGEEFIATKNRYKHCGKSCSQMGEKNYMYGKYRELNPFYGKHHTKKTRKRWSKIRKGKYIGKNNNSWKGGYHSKGIPLYDTYANKLNWCEKVRRSPKDRNILEVKCTYCGKWYVPSLNNIRNRIYTSTSNNKHGECKFYCSESCKQACPIYGKKSETLMREDALRAGRLQWLELNREVQPELRQMVLKRDNYTCQKCGTADKPLHCHHIFPVTTDPLESADIDNCITLCEDCHKEAHQQDGCKYSDLKIEIC